MHAFLHLCVRVCSCMYVHVLVCVPVGVCVCVWVYVCMLPLYTVALKTVWMWIWVTNIQTMASYLVFIPFPAFGGAVGAFVTPFHPCSWFVGWFLASHGFSWDYGLWSLVWGTAIWLPCPSYLCAGVTCFPDAPVVNLKTLAHWLSPSTIVKEGKASFRFSHT